MSSSPDRLAHELNNVLCMIMASAEFVLDRVSDSAARAELDAILDMGERAADLVRDLRSSAGGPEPD